VKDAAIMTEPTSMQTFRFRARTIVAALVVVLIAAGCSAEARKARHLNRGEKYFASNEFEKAKLEYLNVLRADPKNATACKRMGAIWIQQGVPLRAGAFLVKAREIAP
jgi:Tfp pilus assembly protein PilF